MGLPEQGPTPSCHLVDCPMNGRCLFPSLGQPRNAFISWSSNHAFQHMLGIGIQTSSTDSRVVCLFFREEFPVTVVFKGCLPFTNKSRSQGTTGVGALRGAWIESHEFIFARRGERSLLHSFMMLTWPTSMAHVGPFS